MFLPNTLLPACLLLPMSPVCTNHFRKGSCGLDSMIVLLIDLVVAFALATTEGPYSVGGLNGVVCSTLVTSYPRAVKLDTCAGVKNLTLQYLNIGIRLPLEWVNLGVT